MFKYGLIIGGGIGYVLGAKAGRERYEQIMAWFRAVGGSDMMHSMTDRGRGWAGGTVGRVRSHFGSNGESADA